MPYSGSPTADAALEVAGYWSSALGAEASVLYVRPRDSCRGGHFYVETRSEARACAELAELRLRRGGVCASTLVRDAERSKVSDTIVAVAEALGASFIVLGTQGRGPLSAALFGSTSSRVTRRARCPVILVKTACG